MEKPLFAKIKPYRFRILSGFLFCIFLICTWLAFYQKPKYPESLHISLQEQLKNIIQETLLKKQPQAKNLQFQKMWTQATYQRDQISAHFKYSFDDKDGVSISVSGQALMNRKNIDNSKKHELWSVDHFQTNNTSLKFDEPITLFSGKVDSNTKEVEDIDDTNENQEEAKEVIKQEPEQKVEKTDEEVKQEIQQKTQPKVPEKIKNTEQESEAQQSENSIEADVTKEPIKKQEENPKPESLESSE